ncbi:MAG TPA: dihydrofolate reductase, partial [Mycobacterium sp.]
MSVTLVAAVARNGVIGADGGLPWHLPDDLRRFKALTMGHTMIMGRRTFESIGRALPGRVSIVVTRDAGWTAPGVTVAHSVEEALALAGPDAAADAEVMVVGGGEIYRQTLELADR